MEAHKEKMEKPNTKEIAKTKEKKIKDLEENEKKGGSDIREIEPETKEAIQEERAGKEEANEESGIFKSRKYIFYRPPREENRAGKKERRASPRRNK